MKTPVTIVLTVALILLYSCSNSIEWEPGESPLMTRWASDIDPAKPWDHYPRPGMERGKWANLNGLWDFAITARNAEPSEWNRQILVPYPVESALSGISERVSADSMLWYSRSITIPLAWKGNNIILHFEASDWETTVYIDDKPVGTHRGGYDPFSFNITDYVGAGRKHTLKVSVWDPTDSGTQPRGKQVSNPRGIWYTPVSGIWQTVWMEPVNSIYLESFKITNSVDTPSLTLEPKIYNVSDDLVTNVSLSLNGSLIAPGSSAAGDKVKLSLPPVELWQPGAPVLYDIEVSLSVGDEIIDRVKSYTGFRKVSIGKDDAGITRIMLNKRFVFQNGPLDQGFWPDGIYTPPTEEAMVYDLEMTRKMGFNMLRKHVKVENRRFYYWCDKMGLLVWQDMPSGDSYIWGEMADIEKDPDADIQFRQELEAMINTKFNNPSIIVWVPFNEGWGQYNTGGITSFIRSLDPGRLVNSASGWTDRGTGDILDIHHYPEPVSPAPEEKRAIVLGEFGGLGLPVQDHTWEQRNWGYRNMTSREDLLSRYEIFYSEVHRLVENGLSAVVYTQTTDVETGTNGLMTYDREVDKMGYENVTLANAGIVPPQLASSSLLFTDSYDVELLTAVKDGVIRYTTDGTEPGESSPVFTEPFTLSATTTLKAAVYTGSSRSRTIEYLVEKTEPSPSADVSGVKPGLRTAVYKGQWTALPDFNSLEAAEEKIVQTVSSEAGGNSDYMGLTFEGYLMIPSTGVYGLFVNSDDGSRLYINGNLVADNDGIHGMREAGDYLALEEGLHSLRIEYFQGTGGIGLEFIIEDKTGTRKIAGPGLLFH